MLIQSKNGFIFRINEGTGDNLLAEDVEEGYVDYIYYDYYETLKDLQEDKAFDGGMVLLKEYYVDLSREEILKKVADMSGEEFNLQGKPQKSVRITCDFTTMVDADLSDDKAKELAMYEFMEDPSYDYEIEEGN